MTKADIIAALRALNPRATDAHVAIYAAAFLEHSTAQANIDRHGTIVFHPRTGSPIDNPYVSVRDRSAKTLLSLALKTGDLWRLATWSDRQPGTASNPAGTE
jgi:hypothetical protein